MDSNNGKHKPEDFTIEDEEPNVSKFKKLNNEEELKADFDEDDLEYEREKERKR